MGDRVLVGVVGKPHGVRGLVRVHSYTADPVALAGYNPLFDDQGRQWSIAWRGEGVAQLSDAQGAILADRDAAGRMTNLRLLVDRDRLPPAAADEFYLADLIGLRAVNAAGAPVGQVMQVHDYGAGVSLEIARDGAPALILPFTKACVPVVDVAAGRITVAPPDEVVVPGADGPENEDGEEEEEA